METAKKRILVVDDEESLCEILQFNLEVSGFQVDVAYSGEQALEMHLESYDLILLDVMMGGISGFRMAQIMKKDPALAAIPIIFCTAKDTEDDTVTGLTLGADDYIAKPFSVREVIARVKTVLRRSSKPELAFEGIRLDLQGKRCLVDEAEVALTKTEFELLAELLRNRGRILSREELLRRVWGQQVVVLDRTIDVNVTRLRKKLGTYGTYLISRQGYGYGFDA